MRRTLPIRWLTLLTLCSAMACWAQRTPIAQVRPIPYDLTPQVNLEECGDFVGHYGPLDFRTIHPLDKRNVESNHFDLEVRTFLSGRLEGKTRAGVGSVMGGFDYTARAIPNHPTVLLVLEEYGRRVKSEKVSSIPLECYYMRAFMIAPDDPVVRAIYGVYLSHRGRESEALANLKLADEGTRDMAAVQYQIGLAHLRLKQYRLAQLNALRTAQLKFPLDVLQRTLRAAGKWDDTLKLPPAPPELGEQPAAAASAPALAPAAPDAPSLTPSTSPR